MYLFCLSNYHLGQLGCITYEYTKAVRVYVQLFSDVRSGYSFSSILYTCSSECAHDCESSLVD